MADDQTKNVEGEFHTYLKKVLLNPELLKISNGELKRILANLRLLNDPNTTREILMEIRDYANDKSVSEIGINAAIEEIKRGIVGISQMNQGTRMKIVHENSNGDNFKKRKKSSVGQHDFLKVVMKE